MPKNYSGIFGYHMLEIIVFALKKLKDSDLSPIGDTFSINSFSLSFEDILCSKTKILKHGLRYKIRANQSQINKK